MQLHGGIASRRQGAAALAIQQKGLAGGGDEQSMQRPELSEDNLRHAAHAGWVTGIGGKAAKSRKSKRKRGGKHKPIKGSRTKLASHRIESGRHIRHKYRAKRMNLAMISIMRLAKLVKLFKGKFDPDAQRRRQKQEDASEP